MTDTCNMIFFTVSALLDVGRQRFCDTSIERTKGVAYKACRHNSIKL